MQKLLLLQIWVLAAFVMIFILSPAAHAANSPDMTEVFVTRFDDPPPDSCSPSDCSLREAIIDANSVANPNLDTIRVFLQAGTYQAHLGNEWYEDQGYTGDLDITGVVSISGAGPNATTITGMGDVERAFDVPHKFARAEISNLSIRDLPYTFAPIDCGKGIRNEGGTLTVRNVIIDHALMRGDGGGICNEADGTLNVTDVTISNSCGCLAGIGGAIFNTGTATLTRVNLTGNKVDWYVGGAISSGGTLTVTDSSISNNTVTAPLGNRRGGGISAGGTVNLTNVTVSGNYVDPSNPQPGNNVGGGLSIEGDATNVTIANSTIVNNSAEVGGGGISKQGSGALTLINTIVGNNTGGDCQGTISSSGHNLDSDGSCGLTGAGDQSELDPQVGVLADNGGPTQTHALLPGSPAIDAGDAGNCPATDQRGAPRPFDGDSDGVAVCDIGAFEAGSQVPPPPPPLQGDVNCDGDLNSIDALLVLRYSAGLSSGACISAGDLNCNSVINSVDALLILRRVAGLPEPSPAPCA